MSLVCAGRGWRGPVSLLFARFLENVFWFRCTIEVRFSMAATNLSVGSGKTVDGGSVACGCVEVNALTVMDLSSNLTNSDMRSAVAARIVTSSMLVLAKMVRMLVGRVFKKNLQRTAFLLSNVKPRALRSSMALARKIEGFWEPRLWALKYLLNVSACGSCPNERIALFSLM